MELGIGYIAPVISGIELDSDTTGAFKLILQRVEDIVHPMLFHTAAVKADTIAEKSGQPGLCSGDIVAHDHGVGDIVLRKVFLKMAAVVQMTDIKGQCVKAGALLEMDMSVNYLQSCLISFPPGCGRINKGYTFKRDLSKGTLPI